MMGSAGSQSGAIYEIQVQGELDRGWEAWLDGLTMGPRLAAEEPATTTLTGPVPDQAALRGLLCRLWDLNLTLVSVRRLEVEDEGC
jgi:hypothetical protein